MNEILGPKISNPLYSDKESNVEVVSKTRKKVNILWTGGFDSTFRVIQLSKLNIEIQPYYLYNNRKSEKHELLAIKAITADITAHPETKASILPLLRIKTSDIEPDELLTEAYHRLYKKYSIGIQYEWLGRFSKLVPGIELVIEKGDSSKFYHCLLQNTHLVTIENEFTSYCVADRQRSDSDFLTVCGNFHFPHHILNITKQEIAELYKELGFEHTLAKTWFCHNPINNLPCGMCNPCKSVVDEGLSFRIGKQGMKRYRLAQKYDTTKWFRYYIKLYRLVAG